MTGKEAYALSQKMKKQGKTQAEISAFWDSWRKERGLRSPPPREYSQHYEKSFFIDPTKVPSR